MTPSNHKTVVFVFSLSAQLEAERKPLFGPSRKKISKHFFKFLNNKTLALAKQSGVDVVWMDETKQEGANFSERLSNAYQALFDQGYQKVISIGNDAPNLTSKHLKIAIKSLSTNKMVYGPSQDGGVYLLGCTKNAFNKNEFKKLPWLTSSLAAEIHEIAIESGLSFSVLEVLVDIDSKKNALEFAYANLNTTISTYILLNLVTTKLKYSTKISLFRLKPILQNFLLRGPPSPLFS